MAPSREPAQVTRTTPTVSLADPRTPSLIVPEEELAGRQTDELIRLVNEAGPESNAWNVHVFKRRADGSKIDRCKRFSLAEFDLDRLPKLYGGGDYTLRVLTPDGSLKDIIRVSFDPAILPDAPTTTTPTDFPSAPKDAYAAVLETLERERSERMKFMESMVTALAGSGKGGGTSLRERLEEIRLLQSISGSPHTPPADTTILDAVKVGMELAGRGAENGEPEDPTGKIIEKYGPPLIERILMLGQGRKPDKPRGAIERHASPTGKLPPEWQQYAFLRGRAGQLLEWASKGRNPDLLADLIYELVPERESDNLSRFVHLDPGERIEILCALDPAMSAHRAYLTQVADTLKSIYDEEQSAEPEPSSTPEPA